MQGKAFLFAAISPQQLGFEGLLPPVKAGGEGKTPTKNNHPKKKLNHSKSDEKRAK